MRKIAFKALEFARKTFSGKLTHSWPFVGKIYNFLYSYLKPDFIKTEGGVLYLDRGDILGLLRNKGVVEKYETDLFKKNISPGDTVIDLGAHIGYYTTLAAKLVGESGQVIAFEAEEKTFALLSKNIAVNHLRNVKIHKLAVANLTQDINLYLYGSGQNSLGNLSRSMPSRELKNNAPVSKIHAVALDDFLGDKQINFIKMDIEGGEGLALLGMRELLSKNQNVKILSEFNCPALEAASNMSGELFLDQIKGLGFNICSVDKDIKRILDHKEFVRTLGSGSAYIFCFR